MATGSTTQVAYSTPFDNSTNGFIANTTQGAIEELQSLVQESSKAFTFCQYNGNAGTGRHLEFFSGIGSNDAPLRVIGPLTVLTIVARTTGVNATCTIGFYDDTPITPVLLYTLTFSASKEVVLSVPTPGLFIVPADGKLRITVTSGSISKPHLYFTGQGG
jgi:hypothetical protein